MACEARKGLISVSQLVADLGNVDGFSEIDEVLEGLADEDGILIPALHKAQEIYGYLSREVQIYIAQKLEIPAAKVYGVATFYQPLPRRLPPLRW